MENSLRQNKIILLSGNNITKNMTDTESEHKCFVCVGRMWEVEGDIFLEKDEIHITSLTHFCPKCNLSWYYNSYAQTWEKLRSLDNTGDWK